jgi:peptidyl-tRNA hydrolase
MTAKSDFSEEEWATITEGPTSAGMAVITASKGGTFRETFSMAKAYAEARKTHGESELLDALVGEKPKMDKTREHSYEELLAHNLQNVRDAVGLLQRKATAEELEDYRGFIRGLAKRVAEAHSEDGQDVSPEEQAAIDQIENALRDQPA